MESVLHGPLGKNAFYLYRVLSDCVLIKIASFRFSRIAEGEMSFIAESVPGSYVVFSKRTQRVVARYRSQRKSLTESSIQTK